MSTTKKQTAPAKKTTSANRGKISPVGVGDPKGVDEVNEVQTPALAEAKRSETGETNNMLRKRELVDAVVRSSGVKKKDAKPVVEAALAELGKALAEGRELALPPLGRVKINREKQLEDGRVLILKLRQKELAQTKDIVPAAE